jgi:hypothetical protein
MESDRPEGEEIEKSRTTKRIGGGGEMKKGRRYMKQG